jgi:hypothetical protein
MTSPHEACNKGELDAAISNAVAGLVREHVHDSPSQTGESQ